jgi:ABC-2 type transport system ATP-binding protein
VIEAARLVKDYGSRRVLDGVSFVAAPGRITALLGANGAGKTTTLRILLGLVRPTAGTATFDGRSLRSHARPACVVGFATSASVGPPGRSGRTQARLVAELGHLPRESVDEALVQVGLGAAADRPIGVYSTGMRRRLALAIALLGRPRALVLDEPTNGIDPLAARAVWDLLAGLADAGTSVLVATHHLADVLARGDDVVILRGGRAVFAGPAKTLGASPADVQERALELLGGREAAT